MSKKNVLQVLFISFTENFLGFDSIGQNVDVLKEVFSHIIETVEGEFMNDSMSKSLVDVNNNSDFKRRKNPKKSQKGKEQIETRLTRSKRKASGGSLVNPRKFYPCLICGEKKHMDYSPHQLKNHYRYILTIYIQGQPLGIDRK